MSGYLATIWRLLLLLIARAFSAAGLFLSVAFGMAGSVGFESAKHGVLGAKEPRTKDVGEVSIIMQGTMHHRGHLNAQLGRGFEV